MAVLGATHKVGTYFKVLLAQEWQVILDWLLIELQWGRSDNASVCTYRLSQSIRKWPFYISFKISTPESWYHILEFIREKSH